MFFDREYVFRGKHAQYVNELKEFVFKRNLDVLILAPIVGLVYNRKSSVDKEGEFENLTTKIFGEQMNSEKDKILFNYRLCMLLNDDISNDEKIDNAFKYYIGEDSDKEDLERFENNIKLYNSYILGGVEVLYEMIIAGNNGVKSDIIKKTTEFIADYIDEVNTINQTLEEWN